jgi:hypothetical protein
MSEYQVPPLENGGGDVLKNQKKNTRNFGARKKYPSTEGNAVDK